MMISSDEMERQLDRAKIDYDDYKVWAVTLTHEGGLRNAAITSILVIGETEGEVRMDTQEIASRLDGAWKIQSVTILGYAYKVLDKYHGLYEALGRGA